MAKSIELFNQEQYSDVHFLVNDKEFFLMSHFIKDVPFFASALNELPKVQKISANADVSLCLVGKRIIKLVDEVNIDILTQILKSLYGDEMKITNDNVNEMYKISVLLGMTSLTNQCIKLLENSINLQTLLSDYQKAIEEKSELIPIYEKSFKNNIYFLPKNDVIKFFEILSPNDVYSILQSDDLAYDEQLVYEIASNYCFKLSDTKVMSFVRLCALSNEFLVTQIKNNPLISKDKYLEELENRVHPTKTSALRNMSSAIKFGIFGKKYDGYRSLTKQEFCTDTFKDLFIKQYNNHGIIGLDDYEGDILFVENYEIKHNKLRLRLSGKLVKGQKIKLVNNNFDKNLGKYSGKILDSLDSSLKCGNPGNFQDDVEIFILHYIHF